MGLRAAARAAAVRHPRLRGAGRSTTAAAPDAAPPTRAPSSRTGAHKEVEDLLAGVDYAIAQGIADPQRLGVGGWSYGGILTDYIIASDARFKAAISGAGSGNQTGTYGTDEYIVQYNAELGPPWQDTALWLKVSYPFFHADRIHTPTLFLGGTRTSTSRSPAASRCIRRCVRSACPRS